MKTSAPRDDLASKLRCEVRFDEPLSRYTTYRIGGPATALILPRHPEDAITAVRFAEEAGLPWLPLGLGSNLLVADRGFAGVVIRLGKGLDQVSRSGEEGAVWTVGAGLPVPLLARQSARQGHGGVQRLIGVPGTVGGGAYMNAGAHGQDFASVVRSVTVIDRKGDVATIPGSQLAWRYRSSGLDSVVVLEAAMGLTPGDPAATQQELQMYLRKRKEGTPFDEPCCGSVFRNPGPAGTEARTAGQLIEASGLKGFRVGAAQVSPVHANYIVNLGSATAADVRRVIDTVQERVLRDFGVELALEVKFLGF